MKEMPRVRTSFVALPREPEAANRKLGQVMVQSPEVRALVDLMKHLTFDANPMEEPCPPSCGRAHRRYAGADAAHVKPT